MAILYTNTPSTQYRTAEAKAKITSRLLNTTNLLNYPDNIPVRFYKDPEIISGTLYIYPFIAQKDFVAVVVGDIDNPSTPVMTYSISTTGTYYIYLKYTYTGDPLTQQPAQIIISDSELTTSEYLLLFRVVNGQIFDLDKTLFSMYKALQRQYNIKKYEIIVHVESKGLDSTIGDKGIWINDNKVLDTTRSYGLVVIDRNTGAVVFSQSYDLFDDQYQAQYLANKIAQYDNNYIVIINTYDEPQANRLNADLVEQIIRCGGTKSVFTSPYFKYRSAYILIGIPDIGEGNGIELYSGNIDSDPRAWCECTITIADGNITSSPGSASYVSGVKYEPGAVVVNGNLTVRSPTNLEDLYIAPNHSITFSSDNTDQTSIRLVNYDVDKTALRLDIGDNGNIAGDFLQIGATENTTGNFVQWAKIDKNAIQSENWVKAKSLGTNGYIWLGGDSANPDYEIKLDTTDPLTIWSPSGSVTLSVAGSVYDSGQRVVTSQSGYTIRSMYVNSTNYTFKNNTTTYTVSDKVLTLSINGTVYYAPLSTTPNWCHADCHSNCHSDCHSDCHSNCVIGSIFS